MNYKNQNWAIIGDGEFAFLLFNLMIREGFDKELFEGFIILKTNNNIYDSLNFFSPKKEKLNSRDIVSKFNKKNRLKIYSSIGYRNLNKNREEAFIQLEKFESFLEISSFVSEEAYLGNDINIGIGCVILPKCIVENNSEIKKGTVLWFGSHICHDSIIYEFCWLAARSIVGSKCKVGERSFIGIGGIVPSGANIASGNLLTAGSIASKFSIKDKVFLAGQKEEVKNNTLDSNDFIRFL